MAITTKFETRDDTCRLFKCFFFIFNWVVNKNFTQDVTVMGAVVEMGEGFLSQFVLYSTIKPHEVLMHDSILCPSIRGPPIVGLKKQTAGHCH